MSEQIYDKEIAPLLMKAAKLCETYGLNMVAAVEYGTGPDDVGGTRCYALENAGPSFLLAALAERAQGNLDSLVIAIRKRVGKNHTSAFLAILDSQEPSA